MEISVTACQEIQRVLEEHHSFLITAGDATDGDSVGCMLALGLALKRKEKEVIVYIPGTLPPNLTFLPGQELLRSSVPPRRYEVMLVVDIGSSKRLFDGDKRFWRSLTSTVVNLDHHAGNDRFGDINLIDAAAAAVGEMIFRLLIHMGWEIDPDIATCLLVSVMADTGGFKYPNTSAFTLMVASELLGLGAQIGKIARPLFSTKSPPGMRLLGKMLCSLKEEEGGRLVWTTLTRKDFEEASAPDEEAEKIVEEMDRLRDVKVYCLFRETRDGRIRISLRSRDDIPVNEVAGKFGGGGHTQAAGCFLSSSLESAQELVLKEVRSLLQRCTPAAS